MAKHVCRKCNISISEGRASYVGLCQLCEAKAQIKDKEFEGTMGTPNKSLPKRDDIFRPSSEEWDAIIEGIRSSTNVPKVHIESVVRHMLRDGWKK
jgi:hypothetical protein